MGLDEYSRGDIYLASSQVGMWRHVVMRYAIGQLESFIRVFYRFLVVCLCLLGVFPLIAKKIYLNVIKARRVYAGFTKPKTF